MSGWLSSGLGSPLGAVVEVRTNAFTARSATVGGIQMDAVVFERAPQSFNEHVLDHPTCPVH
jgi:hypothetical protein